MISHSRVNTQQFMTPTRRPMGRVGSCCLLLMAIVSLGCETPAEQSLTQVNGQVSFEGSPLSGARVVFVPTRATQQGWDIPFSYGMTDESGAFSLRTETGQPGVVEGWSEVWVIEMPEAPASQESSETSVLRYSRHLLEVTPNFDWEWSVEIDHKRGFRTQASIAPPAWTFNLRPKWERPAATRERKTRTLGEREGSS